MPCGTENLAETVPTCLSLSTRDFIYIYIACEMREVSSQDLS